MHYDVKYKGQDAVVSVRGYDYRSARHGKIGLYLYKPGESNAAALKLIDAPGPEEDAAGYYNSEVEKFLDEQDPDRNKPAEELKIDEPAEELVPDAA